MANVPTIELALELPAQLHDLLIAEMDAAGFTGFVQDVDGGDQIQAYVPRSLWTEDLKSRFSTWLADHNCQTSWREAEIIPQDWNETWERSIQPITISPFYVRPSWAIEKEGYINIVVDPKMSFGTGHHETTRLLLKLMSRYIKPGTRVLDAGAGTAILAIASIKLGAANALAFDIDAWVTDNVKENLQLNDVSRQITFRVGGMEVISEGDFDVIFANINRNVLLDYMSSFGEKAGENGLLFLSGVLVEDQEMMVEATEKEHFTLIDQDHEGAWWAGVFRRKFVAERG